MPGKKFLEYKSFHCKIYRHDVVVILTNSKKKFYKKFKITFPKNFIAFTTRHNQKIYMVFKYGHPDEKVPKMGTICHESLHATKFILHNVGVKASNKNDEAEAYLLTWIVDRTYKALNKFLKKIKK